MLASSTNALILLELSLASGRIAYSVTRDDIFRPVREWIYERSAPDSDTILVRDEAGDHEYPARSFHRVERTVNLVPVPETCADVDHFIEFTYEPALPPREPGWAGCLIECPYCFSFWTSLVLAALWLLLGDVVAILAMPFAVWAIANTYAVKGL